MIGEVIFKNQRVPGSQSELPEYLDRQFRAIAIAIEALAAGQLDVTNVAPDKPRDGMIRYADGTNWNPGSGEGIYAYYGGAWNKL